MVVINLTQDTMAMSVISQLVTATIELSTITNIHKYKGFHEGHHFIPMAMGVHGAPGHDMDCFIKEYVHLFHNRRSRGHLSLSFCFQFFKQCVNIVFKCALAFVIKKKIPLAKYVCFRPLITIRYHDLHVGNVKRAMGEITFYHERE